MEPDLEWYLSVSREREVAPRCPFATVDRCPRYWDSLSMLQHIGYTSASTEESQRLEKKWSGSELRARIAEQDTSISGSQSHKSLANYCPEITYNIFGFFASYLGEYVDDTDREMAYRRFTREGISPNSWQWLWADLIPMHYTECPLYSPLQQKIFSIPPVQTNAELVTLKPAFWGISIDLKECWRRIRTWFRKSKYKR